MNVELLDKHFFIKEINKRKNQEETLILLNTQYDCGCGETHSILDRTNILEEVNLFEYTFECSHGYTTLVNSDFQGKRTQSIFSCKNNEKNI